MSDRKAWIRKRLLAKKQEHEFNRRRERKQRLRRRGEKEQPTPSVENAHAVRIPAPSVFSLIQNSEEVIRFLNLIYYLGKKKARVKILFDDVTSITPDAAMALVSVLARCKGKIGGNVPKSENCKALLMESGFFDHVRHGFLLPETMRGKISRRTSKQVEGALARDLITLGTTAIPGSLASSEASYRVLVEAMQNTCNHANFDAKSRVMDEDLLDKETWWAMVYADVTRGRVCFAFLDTGVGIFRSAKLTWLRKVFRALRESEDQQILADLMSGRIESRTGQAYRGKGLPSMRELCQNGEIRNLVILSNSVHGEVSNDSYRGLTEAFRGTLLYWEI